MEHHVDDPMWRVWWRRAFAAFLVLTLVVGLYLSFRPTTFEEEPDVAGTEPSEKPRRQRPAQQEPEDKESEIVVDAGLSDEEIEELIAAARDPEETTVQVLDAGGGSTATNEAADALREMGYDVVAINSSRTNYPVTTVLYTEGNEAEAQALPARDPRFVETAPNERLSEGVDLHVVVGPDWSG